MREVVYKYNSRGCYEAIDKADFGNDKQLKIVVEPHSFSIAVGGEILRSSEFEGCSALASRNGAVEFYNQSGEIIKQVAKGDGQYDAVRLEWDKGALALQFGHIETVDNYPNCDGEHDRWSTEWVIDRRVEL